MIDILSRGIPIIPRQSALFFIDVQNYNTRQDGGKYKDKGLQPAEVEKKYGYFFKHLKAIAIPNFEDLFERFYFNEY
jgi:ureidoacrylate peracid hydrolase